MAAAAGRRGRRAASWRGESTRGAALNTAERFVSSLGWPLVLIGVSGAAVRLDRRYMTRAA